MKAQASLKKKKNKILRTFINRNKGKNNPGGSCWKEGPAWEQAGTSAAGISLLSKLYGVGKPQGPLKDHLVAACTDPGGS